MQTIGMFEAKTHLPEIIRHVQEGEEYMLTNRHKKVAVIVPVERYYSNRTTSAYNRLKELLKRAPLGNVAEIIQMRDEGRR